MTEALRQLILSAREIEDALHPGEAVSEELLHAVRELCAALEIVGEGVGEPLAVEQLYVICDGPPGPESGRFVEVETQEGGSVSVEWRPWDAASGTWALGPFTRA